MFPDSNHRATIININYSFNIEIYFCEPSLGREIYDCLLILHHKLSFLAILVKIRGI